MRNQEFYSEFVKQFAKAGRKRSDMKAAYIIGSQARKKHPADQWSDLDILIYTADPAYYLETSDFLQQFGEIWSSFATKTLGGDKERLTLFAGGFQVDLVVKTAQEYDQQVASRQAPWLFKRGVQLIIDNTGHAEELLPKEDILPEKLPLNEATLNEMNQMFWFVTMYISKQLLREDNWAAKARDMDYKNILLQLIEWYEQSLHGSAYDTWHGGRFMKVWVESDIYNELFGIFGHFDLADSWSALEQSIRLFIKLNDGIQASTGIFIEKHLQANVTNWIKSKKADFAID
ncbi:aminoglycoside 6-adenylyltransferase [Candidatus Enterococcus clewellii]|uniref:Aminoglycoside 6-adenylyltransferase n=1 Tax=Candidatus Enterococcus clewellii TaxID=1834193 RepID=A0A242KC11_9ENTE|nr:aminoglycoside 6-adenylyltransferase [Enterococcus sp. 9E7_DIV0242]OTP18597.1 hypothetical protein A5888_000411 [Enterococcus sp. 9E7_DIV0242]